MSKLLPIEKKSAAPRSIDELAPYDMAGLLALLYSQYLYRPFAPTLHLSVLVLERLAERQLIHLPWPDSRWLTKVAKKRTLSVELLDWKYTWSAYDVGGLQTVLTEALSEHQWQVDLPESRLELWADLLHAEIISYAAHLLEQHQLDPEWSCDLEWIKREVGRLPLCRWKYIVWAGVRRGTQEKARTGSTAAQIRRTVSQEYQSRHQMLVRGDPGFGSFAPKNPMPYSVLGQVLVDHVLPLHWDYWRAVPSDWAVQRLSFP